MSGYDDRKHYCPPLKTLLAPDWPFESTDDHLAAMLASQTSDILAAIDRRLDTMMDKLIAEIKTRRK